jgi:hypothetical protein
MRSATLAVTLLVSLSLRSAGQGPDTTVALHGFLEPGDSGGWQLMLPEPVTMTGRLVNLLAAHGDNGHWSRLANRFVNAVGRLEPAARDPGMNVERLQEIDPDGMTRTTVHLSFNQTAVVTLAAIPNRFSWKRPDGQASGVQPLLMYTILNHGQSELDFMLPTNDALCAHVHGMNDDEGWRSSLPAPTRTRERIVIRLGSLYRQFVPIPMDAAPRPGRYTARVTLCGVADYAVETQFDVRTP